jgi:hypothetical protein
MPATSSRMSASSSTIRMSALMAQDLPAMRVAGLAAPHPVL